ncbi:MAG: 4'-phosphopantetheinyl transferase superfamily protein [Bacteroides sp.]|nr:4'-phosphopantetheinyl transferase superfamily protein [Bacteroides sp.]
MSSEPLFELVSAEELPEISRFDISELGGRFHIASAGYFDSILKKSDAAFKMSAVGVILMEKLLTRAGAVLRETVIERNANGRPCVKSGSFDFSISHSEGFVLCAAVSKGRVGSDIQAEKRLSSDRAYKLASRFMNGEELERYMRAEDKAAFYYSLWAKKEALIKCEGGSVWDDLTAVAVGSIPSHCVTSGGKRAFYSIAVKEESL